jgi:Na+-driven multidrug efflux pump
LPARYFRLIFVGLFTTDREVLSAGSLYLTIIGPAYGFVGFGMIFYFAGQGAGRVLWPFFSVSARFFVAGILGLTVVSVFGGNLIMLFSVVAVGAMIFGVMNGLVMLAGWWSRPNVQRKPTEMLVRS